MNYLKTLDPNLKRHLLSAGTTFISAFCVVLVANINSITYTTFSLGAISSLIFTAARMGFKAVIETYLNTQLDHPVMQKDMSRAQTSETAS